MTTISADLFVATNPGVLAAGGSAINLNGLILTTDTRVPIGTALSFGGTTAVNSYFGPTSVMARVAGGGVGFGTGYFGGFDSSTLKPAAMLVVQYPLSAVSAYLRGGNISALTLTQLQALSGTLSVTIDSVLATASVNLSSATSFTSAAQLIETDLAISGASQGTVTATVATTVMTVSAVLTGGTPIAVGDKITGAGVTASTFVASFGTGTGGVGTYNLTQSSTIGSPTTLTSLLPAVYFDSVSGGFVVNSGTTGVNSAITFGSGAMATSLLLTQATGAVISQGSAAAVPATFMNSVRTLTNNWASFTTTFDPDNGSGFTQKLAFAAWANSQNNGARFIYMAPDPAALGAGAVPATSSFGYAVTQANYSGTCLLYDPTSLNALGTNIGPMACGFVASINFTALGGRVSFAYKSQAGMVPTAMDNQTAINLGGNPQVLGDRGNSYNYYAAIATANQGFQDFQRGMITGPYLWLDTFANEVWLTSALQTALMNLQANVNSIPFVASGDALIEASLADPITAAINFGAVVPGTVLAANQIAAVNAAAGKNIAPTISSQGWYLLIVPATPTLRASRGPRQVTYYYADGGSVQSINLGVVTLI
jgi:hypothetical protein